MIAATPSAPRRPNGSQRRLGLHSADDGHHGGRHLADRPAGAHARGHLASRRTDDRLNRAPWGVDGEAWLSRGGVLFIAMAEWEVRRATAHVSRARESHSHARQELVVHERLHDVVVTAAREAAHAVDGIASRAHHDHRHIAVPAASRLAFAQAAAELEPGRVGEELERLLRRQ
jgi:hypothetical protein